ncbi:cupin domain-containing protein [Nocardioides halotolerans]|uniref:cupin domain-containing protein n=1 Tax=Nocardioides halotolerans TaxID=433660 RepID=UPI00041BCE2B|nr:cupin domain-containing protein [Nocardioides halotolerans]
MTEDDFFAPYVRVLDGERVASTPDTERYSQALVEKADPYAADVRWIRTPPGGGSPRGPHTHEHEQLFYILEGTMEIEILGRRTQVGPGSVVVFPKGVEHRNWNETDRPTVHLAVNIPVEAQS